MWEIYSTPVSSSTLLSYFIYIMTTLTTLYNIYINSNISPVSPRIGGEGVVGSAYYAPATLTTLRLQKNRGGISGVIGRDSAS